MRLSFVILTLLGFAIVLAAKLPTGGESGAVFSGQAPVAANLFTTNTFVVSPVGAWTTGLTHTPASGSNRLLIFAVGYENGADPGVSSVSFGGQALTRIDGAVAGTSFFGRVELWYLKESGIAAASGTTFGVVWGGSAPSQPMYAAATYRNVNQSNPIGASSVNSTDTSTPNPITTGVGVANGTLAVSAAISGNSGSYTWNNGWSEGSDQESGNTTTLSTADHVETGGGTDTASATHSGPNRQAIVATVINSITSSVPTPTSTATATQTPTPTMTMTPTPTLTPTATPIPSLIAFRTAASAGAGSGVLTLTINKPAGTVSGDVMIAGIAVRPETATITPPSGWTLVRRVDNANPNANSLAIYRKVAGGSEPSSYGWTFSTSTGSAGGILTFSGVDASSPVDVEDGQNTGNGLSHASPSVITTVPNTMLVTFHAFTSAAAWAPPSGMTEACDVASETVPQAGGISIECNYASQAAAGSTGAKTATAGDNADVGNAAIVVLQP